ncbi:MAG: chemotaxis protein CheW, partial [bacterium]
MSGVPTMSKQWVVFQVNGQEYGLSVDQVIEVLRMALLTPVAEAPRGFAGILNLRGNAVPVLDLVERLGGVHRDAGLDQAIVIVMIDNRLVGLVVDAVDEVVDLDEDSIRPADALLGSSNNYLGVARLKNADTKEELEENYRVILLIDVDRLVRSEWSRLGGSRAMQLGLGGGNQAEPIGR